jgi:TolB-like protein
MKRFLYLLVPGLALLLAGCASFASFASFSGGNEFDNIDALVEDSAWNIVEVLWNNYEDLDTAPMKTMAVYYFLEGGRISPLSDTLIEGLTTELANAVAYEGVQVRVVSRTVLDRILEELSFQSSDLVDPQTQRSVGKQLGADLVVTGVISPAEQGEKFNVQVVEVETGVVLGGFIRYLVRE